MKKGTKKTSRIRLFFLVLVPTVGAVLALPGQGFEYLYTWRCISTLEQCERSFVSPSTANILSEKLNHLNRSNAVISRIAVSEKRPVFGSRGVEVSAIVGDRREAIGFFETSDVSSVLTYERADLLRSAVFVPASPKHGIDRSSVAAKLHLFDINSGILYTEIEFRCSAKYSANFRMFNMRWGEAEDANTLSADIASNCDFLEITGQDVIRFRKDNDSANGRVFLNFDDQLILSDFWTDGEKCVTEQREQYEIALHAFEAEEKKCIDQAEVNGNVVGFSGECQLTGPKYPYACDSETTLKLVSFIGLSAAGKRISESMYCDASVLEKKIVSERYAYVLCGNAPYTGPNRTSLFFELARFDKDSVTLTFRSDTYDFSIRGIEVISDNSIEFDIFSTTDVFELQDVELSIEAKTINEEFSNPYRGRFGVVFSDTEALLDFYRK